MGRDKVDGLLAYECEDHCSPTAGGWQVAFRWDTSSGIVHKVNTKDTLCPGCGKTGNVRSGYTQVIDRPPYSTIREE